jgi:hypothetical protein
MKTSLLYLSALSLGCLLYACSGSQYASRYQEHDDMYFTSADRTEAERFASNSNSYLSAGHGQSKQVQQRNYSSTYQSNPTFRPNNNNNSNSNPDYYQQEGFADDSTGAIVEYYRDNYVGFNNQNPTSGTFQGDNWNYQAPQYSMQMGMSPWGNNFGWQMGMPLSNNLWMGVGSGWGNGFYDPWGWNNPWAWNSWHRPWGWNSWNRPRGWNHWGWNQPVFWGGEPVRRVVYRPRGSNLSSGSTMLNNPQNNNNYNVQNARRQRTYATGNRNEQSGTSSAVSNSGRTRNRTSNNYTMGGNETYRSSTSGGYNNSNTTQQRRSSSGMFYNNNQNNNGNRQSSSYQNNSNNNSSSYGSGSSGRSRTSSSSGSFNKSNSSSSGSSGYRSSGSSGRSSGSSSGGGRSGGGRSRP